MPRYSFACKSPDHNAVRHGPMAFERMIQHNEGKRIDQCQCECGGIAKRDFAQDVKTVAPVGMTPISHTSRGKGTLAHETEYAFGRFKRNPDGSVDKNHRPFRDTGELQRFMDGENDLGKPIIDDNGRPVRRKDGSIVRQGAKLFKYGPNATPSRDGVRKRPFQAPRNIVIDSGWGDEQSTRSKTQGGGTMRPEEFKRVEIPVSPYKSPERRKKA